jgi:hypothetical protein
MLTTPYRSSDYNGLRCGIPIHCLVRNYTILRESLRNSLKISADNDDTKSQHALTRESLGNADRGFSQSLIAEGLTAVL